MGQAADDAYEAAEELYCELQATMCQARRYAETLSDEELVQTIEDWAKRPGFAPTMQLTLPICQTFRQNGKKLSSKQRFVLESEYACCHYLADVDFEDGSPL